MQTPNTLNITVGTDVILNVTLEHEGVVLNPALIDNLQANLITGLGRKTPLETSTGIDYIVVNIPWVDGRLPGCYSLEITGSINDLAWSAVGKSIIRYTSATEIGRSTVNVDGDHYDVTMEVGYFYTDSPIEGVNVTVDDQVGTPDVDYSYIHKVLSMDFKNLKGNGIKSIEQTTTSTEDHGVNVVAITDDLDNTTNVEVRNGGTGPQGRQGIPGESAVFDPTTGNIAVIEQTTGNSITNPMSQKAVTDAIVSQIERSEDIPDLAFTDESANAIVVFHRGHVKTKNFDSEDMANAAMSTNNQHSDLTIEDEQGKAVVIFGDGHIKTKNFDSKNIVLNEKSEYEGMRISILGDSISTFGTSYEEGIEAAQANDKGDWTWVGNRCRYPQANLFVDVKYQYWYLLMEKLGLVLGVNESWAGSRISNTSETDTGDVGPNRHMASLTRIGHLGENGTPDIILVYGGTNDAGNSVPIGTFNTSNPKNLTEEDIANLPVATFADAYRAMLIRLQYYYPYARIICLFPNFAPSYYSMTSLDDYEEIIREECDFFGVEYVDLRTAGVNFKNSSSYLTDGIHPNAEGMRLIYKRLLKTVFN